MMTQGISAQISSGEYWANLTMYELTFEPELGTMAVICPNAGPVVEISMKNRLLGYVRIF